MTKQSRKIVETAAAVLNKHVSDNTDLGQILLQGGETAEAIVGAVNEILSETAEGSSIVVAREMGGLLLGFIPRNDVEIPTVARRPVPPDVPPPGPDAPLAVLPDNG